MYRFDIDILYCVVKLNIEIFDILQYQERLPYRNIVQSEQHNILQE